MLKIVLAGACACLLSACASSVWEPDPNRPNPYAELQKVMRPVGEGLIPPEHYEDLGNRLPPAPQ